jgi:hypothetical protein
MAVVTKVEIVVVAAVVAAVVIPVPLKAAPMLLQVRAFDTS